MNYGLDRASFNQGANAKYDFKISAEEQPTLTARGPGAVATDRRSIVLGGQQDDKQSVCRSRQADFAGGVHIWIIV